MSEPTKLTEEQKLKAEEAARGKKPLSGEEAEALVKKNEADVKHKAAKMLEISEAQLEKTTRNIQPIIATRGKYAGEVVGYTFENYRSAAEQKKPIADFYAVSLKEDLVCKVAGSGKALQLRLPGGTDASTVVFQTPGGTNISTLAERKGGLEFQEVSSHCITLCSANGATADKRASFVLDRVATDGLNVPGRPSGSLYVFGNVGIDVAASKFKACDLVVNVEPGDKLTVHRGEYKDIVARHKKQQDIASERSLNPGKPQIDVVGEFDERNFSIHLKGSPDAFKKQPADMKYSLTKDGEIYEYPPEKKQEMESDSRKWKKQPSLLKYL